MADVTNMIQGRPPPPPVGNPDVPDKGIVGLALAIGIAAALIGYTYLRRSPRKPKPKGTDTPQAATSTKTSSGVTARPALTVCGLLTKAAARAPSPKSSEN